MKNIYLLLIACLFTTGLSGQQEIILTKYTFNELFFNPAFAGSKGKEKGSLSLQYRNQWMGIEGAPTTMLAAGEYSFFENKLGLGLTLGQESIGVNSTTEAALNTAYRIELENGFLSGGIRTGFSFISSDFSKLTIKDSGDIFGNSQIENITLFSVGTGIYYYQEEGFRMGLSVPNIVTIGEGTIQKKKHIYGHLGARIGDDYSSILWQPSLLVKYEKSVPLQLTLGVQAWLDRRFAPGLHYRVGESVAISFEVALNDQFSMTAAYDFTANDLHEYTSGSLEIMLAYQFGNENR